MKVTTVDKLTLEDVQKASTYLNALWPLSSFIAVNALNGMESKPFEQSMRVAEKLFGSRGFLELHEYRQMYETGRIEPADLQAAFERYKAFFSYSEQCCDEAASIISLCELLDERDGAGIVAAVNEQLVKWCGSFLDTNHSQWPLFRHASFFAHWKDLAQFDLSLSLKKCSAWKQNLSALPDDSLEALELLLNKIGLRTSSDRRAYMARQLTLLPGWASYLKFLEQEKGASILTGLKYKTLVKKSTSTLNDPRDAEK